MTAHAVTPGALGVIQRLVGGLEYLFRAALLQPALGKRRAAALVDAIWTIDRLPDVRALRRLLSRL